MMEEYIWLFNRQEYKELTCSILASILFHLLLLAVLASTTIFHPPIGESERIDILWFYPSAPSVWRTEPAVKLVHAPAQEPRPAALGNQRSATPPYEKVKLPGTAPQKTANQAQDAERKPQPPPPPVSVATVKPIVTVPAEEAAEPETEPEMRIPAAIEPLPEVKAAEPMVESLPIKKATATEQVKAQVPVPEVKVDEPKKPLTPIKEELPVKEKGAPPAVKEAGRHVVEKPAAEPPTASRRQPAAPPVPHPPETTTALERRSREIREPADPPRTANPPAESAKGLERKGGISPEAKGETVRKREKAAADKTPPPVKSDGEPRAKGDEVKGIFLPPVKGDLKLEMAGDDELLQRIGIVVLFRELPKTHRSRPMSRAGYRRFRTLTPKVVRTGESTRQAVIEVASDGIYDFKVESGAGGSFEASFTVKLYDNGDRARTKPLGSRRVAGGESIVKVLMPEGLLWEDDTSFSGSIEDSESITKFNGDTGLVWKEYK